MARKPRPVFFIPGYNPAKQAAKDKQAALRRAVGGGLRPPPRALAPVPALRVDRYGRVVSPAPFLPPRRKPKVAKTPAATLARPGVKLPTRKVGTNTAATLPSHAATPARRTRSLADRTPVQKAKRPPVRQVAGQVLPAAAPDVPPADMSIDAQIQAALAPGYLQLDQAEQRQTQQDAAARQVIEQYTQALMNQLQGVPGQVGAAYDKAIADTTSIAGMAADRLTAAGTQSNAGTQADLAAINAPQAQKDALAAQSNQVFAGGGATEFYTRGALPAEGLVANRAAQIAYANTMPLVAGLQGGQYLAKARYDASTAHQKIADERAALAAQVPDLRFKYEAQQSSLAQQAEDNRIKAAALAVNQDIARAQLGLKVQGQQFGQQLSKAKLSLASLNSDRQWKATLQRLGIADASLRLRATELELKQRTRGSKGGFTASQRQKLSADAGTLAQNAYNGFDERDKNDNLIQSHRPLNWGEAIREALNAGIPLKIASAQLRRYYRPGERGRPKNPNLLY